MNFSLALLNLLVGVSLTVTNADYSDLVRQKLERNLGMNGIKAPESTAKQLRQLDSSFLATDFSAFVGDWYDCMHTTLMTFNGAPADKHIVDQVGCDFGLMGEITNVGSNQQTLQYDIFLLNHCWFHDLGGVGQPPCPDDLLDNDFRGDGNVLVKYSFTGIGSFASHDSEKVLFTADHTFLRDDDGEWVPNRVRAQLENADTMECEMFEAGIVCDWHINEYRTATEETKGCKLSKTSKGGGEKDTQCKQDWSKKKCSKGGGKMDTECGAIKTIPNGFGYDSFGSYYLVKDTNDCDVECATDSPTITGQTLSPELQISGCYQGGRCEGSHGCCDCDIDTEEACAEEDPGSFSQGCRNICYGAEREVVIGCYGAPSCEGANGCCDCSLNTEDKCPDSIGFFSDQCLGLCL